MWVSGPNNDRRQTSLRIRPQPFDDSFNVRIRLHPQRGFKFCGPVIVYAFMQAVGMVNDHLITCPRHGEVAVMADA